MRDDQIQNGEEMLYYILVVVRVAWRVIILEMDWDEGYWVGDKREANS